MIFISERRERATWFPMMARVWFKRRWTARRSINGARSADGLFLLLAACRFSSPILFTIRASRMGSFFTCTREADFIHQQRRNAISGQSLASGRTTFPASWVDFVARVLQNCDMSVDTTIPIDVMARMQQAANRANMRPRGREELAEAFAEMNRLRESLRQRIGTVDVAVELIRDARNQ
ncbi:MAG: hypothetical protein ACREHD_15835 [Pirellulales bacterium]